MSDTAKSGLCQVCGKPVSNDKDLKFSELISEEYENTKTGAVPKFRLRCMVNEIKNEMRGGHS
jgi:hypothetical protein